MDEFPGVFVDQRCSGGDDGLFDMDSRIGNALFAKTFDWDSIQGDGHGALLGAPAPDFFAILKIGDLFNSPFQIPQILTEGFS